MCLLISNNHQHMPPPHSNKVNSIVLYSDGVEQESNGTKTCVLADIPKIPHHPNTAFSKQPSSITKAHVICTKFSCVHPNVETGCGRT